MTDVSNASASESAMIALLPTTTDWCHIELAHLTLVYAGLITDLQPSSYNELAKDAAAISMMSGPLVLDVTGVEVFGDVEKVYVLRLRASSELLAMRRVVEDWNASEFPFNAHCTIGPTELFPSGSSIDNIPTFLTFDRIMVGWGDENLTFWLKQT